MFFVLCEFTLCLSRSPLENMHCSLLYEVLNDPAQNVLGGLSPSQWRESRKIILNMILGTDMVHHFEQIKNAQVNADDALKSLFH